MRVCLLSAAMLAALSPAHAGVTIINQPTDGGYSTVTTLLGITDPDDSTIFQLGDASVTAFFSVPMTVGTVPDSFFTWGSPPNTETDTPRVLINPIDTLEIDLSRAVTTFGFEAEPNLFGLHDIQVDFFNGFNLIASRTLSVDGDSGALLFAASSASQFDIITVSSSDVFAIAQVRYGDQEVVIPEPRTWMLLASGFLLGVVFHFRNSLKLSRGFRLAILACLVTALAHAVTPVPVDVTISSRLSMTDHSFLHLVNNTSSQVVLVLTTGDQSSIRFPSQRVTLSPLGSADIDLGLLVFSPGMQLFHVQSRQFDLTQNLPIGVGPFLLEPLTVDGTGIHKKTYPEQYLGSDRYKPVFDASNPQNEVPAVNIGFFIDNHGIGPFSFDSSSADGSVMPIPQLPSPFELARMQPFDVGEIGGTGTGTPLGAPRVSGNEPAGADEAFLRPDERIARRDARANAAIVNSDGAFQIQGKFYLKLPGPVYQPAWAWVTRVWQYIGFWHFIGWAYVASDGSWSVPLAGALPGLQVRVEYQPANRFVQVQDASGNIYTWGDNWNFNFGGVTDIGGRAADFTTNGNLPGVDKLYTGATNEWIRFYNNGMNALRDSPIQVFFPNTLASGKCQQTDSNGNPYAWSCSYWADGKIYIIPQHAAATVVQHEIAHSINSYYWNGNLPPGSGGAHNLTSCYNNGLALTEGFADFMAYWVQLSRTQSSPTVGYINMNIETLSNTVCQAQTGEMRVAAAFWDMYDYWNDGPGGNKYDSWYYVNQGAPIGIYLSNPKNAMSDYLPIIKNGQSAYWQGEMDKLFRLNFIIP